MTARENLRDICRAMSDPGFYPHPVSAVERRDTHISVVFMTGDWVYKIKKPVDFGFLDFTTLKARAALCRREVELNRRLTSEVYSGIAAIRRSAGGELRLAADIDRGDSPEGEWTPVEYAVKMRQLHEGANFAGRLARDDITARDLRALGTRLGEFYTGAERSDEIDRLGDWNTVRGNVEENFRQTEDFADDWLDATIWRAVREAGRAFLRRHKPLFESRVSGNMICNGHGDLRAEHIYFDRGIQIIDCVEFNDRFRYLDPASDLGYLHSNLESLGQRPASLRIIERYAEVTSDWPVYRLLDFYSAYRAMVQVKIRGLRSEQLGGEQQRRERSEAESHLFLALEASLRFSRPTLWVFGGLIAGGKSTLSEQLAGFHETPRYSSDGIRREVARSVSGHGRGRGRERGRDAEFAEGLYRPEMRNRVYGELLARGQERLRRRESVVLDATFSKAGWREEAVRLARDHGAGLIFVEVVCDEATIRDRLRRRESEPGGESGESDARLELLPEFMRSYEPPEEIPEENRLTVRTEGPVADTLHEIIRRGYALQCRLAARIGASFRSATGSGA